MATYHFRFSLYTPLYLILYKCVNVLNEKEREKNYYKTQNYYCFGERKIFFQTDTGTNIYILKKNLLNR